MKSVMGWLVVLVVIVGGAGFGLWQFSETANEQGYALELAELKADFQTNSVGLQLLERDDYRKEVGIALTGYFSNLGKLLIQLFVLGSPFAFVLVQQHVVFRIVLNWGLSDGATGAQPTNDREGHDRPE